MNNPSLKYPNRADMLALYKAREKQRTVVPSSPRSGVAIWPISCTNVPICGPR